jgi:hypothetical protein
LPSKSKRRLARDGGKKLGIGDLKIGACIREAWHRSGALSE